MSRSKLFGRVVVLAAAIGLVWSSPGDAASFQLGDVFAATGSGTVKHFSSSLVLKDTYPTGPGFMTGMAFDSSGNLYVTQFSNGGVEKRSRVDGSSLGAFGSGYNGSPESIVFDNSGNAYVGAVNGDGDVRKFNAAGTPLAQFDVAIGPRGSDWIDLAADQATLFYTSEGRVIHRFDVSADTQLSDFATLDQSGELFALRLLTDGGVLAADSDNIVRLDATGSVVQEYDIDDENGWFALNLDPDGTSFWSADINDGSIHKFNIATGAVLDSVASGEAIFGLAVFGERTQGCTTCGTDVPEPASLVFLTAGLLGMAVWRRRASR